MSRPGREGFQLLKVNNQSICHMFEICHKFEKLPQVWNFPQVCNLPKVWQIDFYAAPFSWPLSSHCSVNIISISSWDFLFHVVPTFLANNNINILRLHFPRCHHWTVPFRSALLRFWRSGGKNMDCELQMRIIGYFSTFISCSLWTIGWQTHEDGILLRIRLWWIFQPLPGVHCARALPRGQPALLPPTPRASIQQSWNTLCQKAHLTLTFQVRKAPKRSRMKGGVFQNHFS